MFKEKFDSNVHRNWKDQYSSWYIGEDIVIEKGLIHTDKIRNCLDFEFFCLLFLEECRDNNIPLTLPRLAIYLKVEKLDIINWATGKFRSQKRLGKNFEYFRQEMCKRMITEIEASRLENALSGRENAKITMFELKSHYPDIYGDKVKVQVDSDINVLSLAHLVFGEKKDEDNTKENEENDCEE